MIDLSTTYLGLSLANPLVVSASPLSGDLAQIEKMANAGAAAVVLPSLFEEQLAVAREAPARGSALNTGGSSGSVTALPDLVGYNRGPEGYLEHLRKVKAAIGIPIIASLNATSPGGWVRYAHDIEAAGADALELNIYHLPTSFEVTGSTLEQTYCDLVTRLKAKVRIPLAVKLHPFFTSLPNMASRLSEAGADGLVLFNRFYHPDFDVSSRAITPTLDLSTSQELRLRLHWVAALFGRLRADLAITGGVHTVLDAIKGLMVGARVVMMTSALLRHGIGYLARVREDLGRWLADNGYESVRSIQGLMGFGETQLWGSGLTKIAVEEVLDWLEVHGHGHCEVSTVAGNSFSVTAWCSVADPEIFERANYVQVVTSYRPAVDEVRSPETKHAPQPSQQGAERDPGIDVE
jgi:dihydroorotate dehydrogenase (fumarate)